MRPVADFGDTLLVGTAAVRRDSGQHNILLMGHRDTVFGKGEAARRPFHIAGDRAYGPGIADMKAGLVMNAFVLAAFQKFAPDIPVVAMMTGDEEIGSQASLSHIDEEARYARAVFNAEPARPTGNFVSGRKGGFTYRFEIGGKAAHAGVNFAEGASAIGELAHKITALHALTDVQQGITLNVGRVSGGSSTNTVAAKASGEDGCSLRRWRAARPLDCRYRGDLCPFDRSGHENHVRAPERIPAAGPDAGQCCAFHHLSRSRGSLGFGNIRRVHRRMR
ncbi:M20/M25/M40 family metallo-hydrolase [Thauera sp. SDU_THAU2]|uniref:M20/M25/M40 family metallo-hydrolase n=1 Tax=Thauera sp. SDU_THAU2 TaxID=3136633 RepID=UPI00311E95DB